MSFKRQATLVETTLTGRVRTLQAHNFAGGQKFDNAARFCTSRTHEIFEQPERLGFARRGIFKRGSLEKIDSFCFVRPSIRGKVADLLDENEVLFENLIGLTMR